MPLKLPEKSYRDDDDNVLKRRLLGAAVLIALAVIVLPLVLDGSGSESRFRRVEQLRQEPPRIVDSTGKVNIPDKINIPRPAPPVVVDDPVARSSQSSESAQRTETPMAEQMPATPDPSTSDLITSTLSTGTTVNTDVAKPQADSEQVVESVAWVIQVGSYADETNALILRDQLRTEGFPAFTSEALNAGSAVFRVKVGPVNNRKEIESVQKQVEILIGQSTLIRKYP